MGGTDISGIGKTFTPTAQTGKMVGGVQEEDLEIQFVDFLNQITANPGNELFSENRSVPESQGMTDDGGNVAEYETYSYRDREIKSRESQTKQLDQNESTETLDAYETEVKDVLKEELGITEEQFVTAMETLGFTAVDLMDTSKLAALVAELTGQEVSDLLCDSGFLNVMQEVNTLSDALLQKLGVTREELASLFELSQEFDVESSGMEPVMTETEQPEQPVQQESPILTENSAALAEKPQTVQQSAEPADNQTVQQPVAEETAETYENQQLTESVSGQTRQMSESSETRDMVSEITETVELQELEETAATEEPDAEQVTEDAEELQRGTDNGEKPAELVKENAGAAKQENSVNHNQTKQGQSQSQSQSQGHPESTVANTFSQSSVTTTGNTQTTGFSGQVDIQNIVRQIVEASRLTVANTRTTMELELNPANLGKVFLEVTSKNGVVSAHIQTQNVVAKEALEAQVAELRQNLNQAGVKVEAVEVTVGSHEFERNLEQNAKENERQAEEQEKAAKGTRHINLNNLDELSGLMTEEESLVAQIMADRGNTVDFTA
ncbi:MAG: flagellar hook-length control protein FliK [Roseburia sp.]